eukprot:TRINITY_DN52900_c0_g1_i1.p1 TRINITY_DN52900_c0_g1~~TRINITY_DN52900_c0_g1_i1.p1  ORF type:complete len:281 (-),score=31.33 TRINITY_DN52900_c0_g1_i1:73-885(-)
MTFWKEALPIMDEFLSGDNTKTVHTACVFLSIVDDDCNLVSFPAWQKKNAEALLRIVDVGKTTILFKVFGSAVADCYSTMVVKGWNDKVAAIGVPANAKERLKDQFPSIKNDETLSHLTHLTCAVGDIAGLAALKLLGYESPTQPGQLGEGLTTQRVHVTVKIPNARSPGEDLVFASTCAELIKDGDSTVFGKSKPLQVGTVQDLTTKLLDVAKEEYNWLKENRGSALHEVWKRSAWDQLWSQQFSWKAFDVQVEAELDEGNIKAPDDTK